MVKKKNVDREGSEFFIIEHIDESERAVSDLTRDKIRDAQPNRFSQSKVIKKFREVHGNRYDYSKVVYLNKNTLVTIVCKEHGKFRQRPSVHLGGSGCKKCAFAPIRKTLSETIKDWKKVHGNRYDYSKVEIGDRGQQSEVTIICKVHGEFKQVLQNHLTGSGCRICGIANRKTRSRSI